MSKFMHRCVPIYDVENHKEVTRIGPGAPKNALNALYYIKKPIRDCCDYLSSQSKIDERRNIFALWCADGSITTSYYNINPKDFDNGYPFVNDFHYKFKNWAKSIPTHFKLSCKNACGRNIDLIVHTMVVLSPFARSDNKNDANKENNDEEIQNEEEKKEEDAQLNGEHDQTTIDDDEDMMMNDVNLNDLQLNVNIITLQENGIYVDQHGFIDPTPQLSENVTDVEDNFSLPSGPPPAPNVTNDHGLRINFKHNFNL